MKKVMFLMAVAGMFAFAACNNNNAETENTDTIAVEAIEEPAVEQVVDSLATEAVEAVAEEVVAQ